MSLPAPFAERLLRFLQVELGFTDLRYDTVFYSLTKESGAQELRVGGRLGSGGKLHLGEDRWFVSYYQPDDETPERVALKARLDEALSRFRTEAVEAGWVED